MNPIADLLNGNNMPAAAQTDARLTQIANAAKQMMQTVKAAQDPKAAMMKMIGSNPQAASILQSMQHGGDLKTLAMNMAKQNGIDPVKLERILMS